MYVEETNKMRGKKNKAKKQKKKKREGVRFIHRLRSEKIQSRHKPEKRKWLFEEKTSDFPSCLGR